MLFRVDFGPIAVSKLHIWYRNFTCCFKRTLQISEITHCHVGKTGYFRLCSFPFSFMLFQNLLVSFWLFIMLFQNHTVWLQKYTPCGNNLILYSSNYFYSMTCVVETVTCGFGFVSCCFETTRCCFDISLCHFENDVFCFLNTHVI